MSEARIKKVNDLIRDEVGRILQAEVDFDDDILVTVMGVETSPTMEHAAVRISVYPEGKIDDALAVIKKEIYDIQQELNGRLTMRKVPKIVFKIDRTEEEAAKVEELLGKIEK